MEKVIENFLNKYEWIQKINVKEKNNTDEKGYNLKKTWLQIRYTNN